VVCENEYMPMHVAKIYSLDRGGFGLAVVRLIVVNTKYSSVLKGSEVGIS
jgi:hypothetical protein